MEDTGINTNYTEIPNGMLEKLFRMELSGTQFSIVMIVLRFTIGCLTTDCELPLSSIKKYVDTSVRNIKKAIGILVSMNVLQIVKEAQGTIPRRLKVNEDINNWIYSTPKKHSSSKSSNSSDSLYKKRFKPVYIELFHENQIAYQTLRIFNDLLLTSVFSNDVRRAFLEQMRIIMDRYQSYTLKDNLEYLKELLNYRDSVLGNKFNPEAVDDSLLLERINLLYR